MVAGRTWQKFATGRLQTLSGTLRKMTDSETTHSLLGVPSVRIGVVTRVVKKYLAD